MRITVAPFTPGKEFIIPVPNFMHIVCQTPNSLVIEGNPPDRGKYQVDRWLQLEFTIEHDPEAKAYYLNRSCMKREKYTAINKHKYSYGNRCRTDWVLKWLIEGL